MATRKTASARLKELAVENDPPIFPMLEDTSPVPHLVLVIERLVAHVRSCYDAEGDIDRITEVQNLLGAAARRLDTYRTRNAHRAVLDAGAVLWPLIASHDYEAPTEAS